MGDAAGLVSALDPELWITRDEVARSYVRRDDAEGLRVALDALMARGEVADAGAGSSLDAGELPEGWDGPDGDGDYLYKPTGWYLFRDTEMWFMLLDDRADVCEVSTPAAEACRIAGRIAGRMLRGEQ